MRTRERKRTRGEERVGVVGETVSGLLVMVLNDDGASSCLDSKMAESVDELVQVWSYRSPSMLTRASRWCWPVLVS